MFVTAKPSMWHITSKTKHRQPITDKTMKAKKIIIKQCLKKWHKTLKILYLNIY